MTNYLNNVNDTIGLIITSYTSIAKCISIIRKYNAISIGEIRKLIENSKFIFEVDYTSHSGVRKLSKCYDELAKNGIECEIIVLGEPENREFLSNLMGSHRQTEIEVQAQIDQEVGED